jgi:hypothetical protein
MANGMAWPEPIHEAAKLNNFLGVASQIPTSLSFTNLLHDAPLARQGHGEMERLATEL